MPEISLRPAQIYVYPASIPTSDQRCFNVVDQRWNNVDSTLKIKQNPTSVFQRCTTLIQCQCPTLKQRRKNVTQRQNNTGTTLKQRCFNLVSTLIKTILNPIGLVMIMDCEIVEYMSHTWIVFILLNEKIFFCYILTIQLLMKYQTFF